MLYVQVYLTILSPLFQSTFLFIPQSILAFPQLNLKLFRFLYFSIHLMKLLYWSQIYHRNNSSIFSKFPFSLNLFFLWFHLFHFKYNRKFLVQTNFMELSSFLSTFHLKTFQSNSKWLYLSLFCIYKITFLLHFLFLHFPSYRAPEFQDQLYVLLFEFTLDFYFQDVLWLLNSFWTLILAHLKFSFLFEEIWSYLIKGN